MLLRKVQKSFLNFKALHPSNGNHFSLAQVYKCTNDSSKSKIIQFVSSRTIVNYERNTSDQSRNVSKITRNLICLKYLRLIKRAIRELGPNPKVNTRLLSLIENAQKNHLSPDFINFAIRISNDTKAKVGLYDLFLSNGCHFLIQYEDIDAAITKHHLLELCERYDGSLIQGETYWPKSFKQKGMVFVRCSNSDPFVDMSKEQLISKLGIELFRKEADAKGVEYWKLFCDPWKLHDVKNKCEDIINVEEAYVGYIPKKIIIPSPHARNSIYNVLLKLCEVPTIDNLYCNINLAHYSS